MSRDICICQEFLTEAHRAKIRSAADQAGLVPHFFTPDQFEEAKACLQDCEILYAHSPDLLREAPASLNWYCCSYAGVDPYCKDPSVFANPDCMLTNSNGYGVTIAEHVVMVTLMLLRRMPEYEAVVRDRGWSNQLPIRSIRDNAFTLLGTGNIGVNVAQRLRGMGAAKITGLSRSGQAVSGFDEVYPISRLEEILPSVKVLVMSLPGTPETPGPSPVERQESDFDASRLRQHDPGIHLRRQRGDVLRRPAALRPGRASEKPGGQNKRILIPCPVQPPEVRCFRRFFPGRPMAFCPKRSRIFAWFCAESRL